jgi:hypothetical protein
MVKNQQEECADTHPIQVGAAVGGRFSLHGVKPVKEERPSFLKKRNKKLLRRRLRHLTHRCSSLRGSQQQKFFGSFFQKRTYFPRLRCAQHAGRDGGTDGTMG